MIASQQGSLSRRLLPAGPLSLALAFLTGPALPAKEPPPIPRIVAGAMCVKGESLKNVSRAEEAGIAFEAKPLETAEWEARLERQAPGMGTALKRHDGSPGPFQVFLLAIRNRSPQRLSFQPGNIVRILGDSQQDHILDYTDLYRFLIEEGKNPEALEGVRSGFFDSGFALEPGESVERLVFFRPFPAEGKKKQLTLLMSSFQVGSETHRAAIPWHFEKEKK